MSSANYDHAVHRANVWLADVTAALGTNDRHYGRRVLRVWLHSLRDRLTVDSAVKFGQQLPELLRGTFYDGWEPRRVPVKHNAEEYVLRFSTEALIPTSDVPSVASAVTQVIADHMSPGQVSEALAELPRDVRGVVADGATVPVPTTTSRPPTGYVPAGSGLNEQRLDALSEAVRTLARGLDGERVGGQQVDPAQVARAARLAEEIRVAAGR
jgi:uncharacterized protein (DUF2267 family)